MNLMDILKKPLVSSDIIGIHFGSLFDATQTKFMEVKW